MTKTIIVNSPLFRHKNPLYDEDSLPPIGLGYIATSLRKANIEVELIDAVFENIPLLDLAELIKSKKPKYVATNIFTTNFEIVKNLIEKLDTENIHFIIGGLSTRTLYKEILEWKIRNNLDVVFGDGETIVKDLVQNRLKEEAKYKKNNKRFFKVDHNSPYFSKDISYIPLDRSFFKNEPIIHPFGFKEANIITSRGCIYNCAFCAAAQSLNKDLSIREKNEDSIVQEIQGIKDKYPSVTSIRVLDDLFLKTKYTIEKAISIFSRFDLQWRSMAHVMTFKGVSIETLKKLKKSGCSELFIGIESGSPRILKSIHKTSKIELIKENLTNVLKAGIDIKGYFIFGFPQENEEDFKLSYELAKYLKDTSIKYGANFRTSVFQFRPYHGTELYHNIKDEKGEITNVVQTKANDELSSLVGRIQFNFHSGNYSQEPLEVVHNYIYLTTNLNEENLFDPRIK